MTRSGGEDVLVLASATMAAWFDQAFGPWYVRLYSHRDQAEAERTLRTLEPWTDLRGPSLDVACGTGRHVERLRERGADAFGIDRSAALLAAAPAGLRGRLVRGDMRALPFPPAAFRTILCLFTSFGYFESDEAHRALLREYARVAAPGGRLALDLANPQHVRQTLVPRSVRRVDGNEVHERRRIEVIEGREVVIKEIAIERPESGIVEQYREEVTLYDHGQVDGMLQASGWRTVTTLGDYEGHTYVHRSPRLLVVAEKEPM